MRVNRYTDDLDDRYGDAPEYDDERADADFGDDVEYYDDDRDERYDDDERGYEDARRSRRRDSGRDGRRQPRGRGRSRRRGGDRRPPVKPAKSKKKKATKKGLERPSLPFGFGGKKDDSTPEDAAAEGNEWVGKQAMATKSLKWGLLGGLACGPVAVAMLLTGIGVPTSAPPTQTVAQVDSGAEARAAEVARQLVVLWAQGSRGQEPVLETLVDVSEQLPDQALFKTSDPAIANISEEDPKNFTKGKPKPGVHAYSVTVSVWAKPLADESAAAERRFFMVPVFVDEESSARAVALPSPVTGPQTELDSNLNYTAQADKNHPMVASATAFLNAMVAGQGDLSRYTAPGAEISAISPPLGTSVEISTARANDQLPQSTTAVTDGQTFHLLLAVKIGNGGNNREALPAEYALTMKSRAGRWEVAALDPVPLQTARNQSRASSDAAASGSSPQESPSSASQPTSSTSSP